MDIYDDLNIIVYNDDCFNVLKNTEAGSVDLFILDLPYANFKFGRCTACKWDVPIDLNKMWVEIKRCMKPTAVIVFFCNTKFGYALIDSNPKWFSYDLIYKKGNKTVGFLSANKMPLRNHEHIYIFKNKLGTYNPQKTEGKPYVAAQRKSLGYYGSQGHRDENYLNSGKREYDGSRHPTSILDFNPPSKTIHSTQKPVKLLEYLIKSYSDEEELVMDFCMGSGSTAIAAYNTNRRFIGCELDSVIYEKTRERLNNEIGC